MHRAQLNPELGQTSLMHHSEHFISVQPDVIWLQLLCSGPERVFDCFTAVQNGTKTYFEAGGVKPVCSGLRVLPWYKKDRLVSFTRALSFRKLATAAKWPQTGWGCDFFELLETSLNW